MEDRAAERVVGRQVDAVGQQPVVAAESGQPPGRVGGDRSLADVDMDADAKVRGQLRGLAQGFVGARE